eukprot:TRINITY_DN76448_c0_g1_i1.p1 TRINITY_DN76448_c0_g1~~TRINITY_DN76448_c0_g1_i1.p1  ORF type:complete len:470 (-),score=63.88 TRINITY_DN76448_c0_g1_i1:266-1639(-)
MPGRCTICCCGTLVLSLLLALLVCNMRIQGKTETAELFRLVRENGYPIESHIATTSDGMHLKMFRLPREGGHPVLLQHGVLDSAWMWVISQEFKPPAFQLYDAGYDVWLGNNRGNCFSTAWNHSVRPTESETFWNFSFEEMGTLDFPAQVGKLLEETGSERMSYVGHSQGSTQFFIAAQAPGVKDLVRNKIDLFVALSPVAYIGQATSPILAFVDIHAESTMGTFPLSVDAAMDSSAVRDSDHMLCVLSRGKLCELVMDAVVGGNWMESPRSISAYFNHFPVGSSVKDITHFAQLMRSGRFQRFDYGSAGNSLRYNSQSPPEYNLSKLTVPTALFFGQYDAWVAPADARKLLQDVNSAVVFHKEYPGFGHSTWQVGNKEAGYWVRDLLVQLRQRRQPAKPASVLEAAVPIGLSASSAPAAALAASTAALAALVASAVIWSFRGSRRSSQNLEPLLHA